ncbi:MAG: hypothetical protein WBE39_07130, partial [Candidatus Competibacter sp.]
PCFGALCGALTPRRRRGAVGVGRRRGATEARRATLELARETLRGGVDRDVAGVALGEQGRWRGSKRSQDLCKPG